METSLPALFERDPAFFFYLGSILIGGIVLLAFQSVRILTRPQTPRENVAPWTISWLDFGLFAAYSIMCPVALQALLYPALTDLIDETWLNALITLVAQSAYIAVFCYYRFVNWRLFNMPVNTIRLSTQSAFLQGIAYYLMGFPFIWVVGVFWVMLLHWLESMGLQLSIEAQDIVKVFAQMDSPVLLGFYLLVATVGAPIAEELVFRAGLYRFLKSRQSTPVAMIISAIVFAAVHWNALSFTSLVAVGMVLCIAYEISGNIKVPIFLHAIFNANSIVLILLTPPELQG